jgi:hypothetical protein
MQKVMAVETDRERVERKSKRQQTEWTFFSGNSKRISPSGPDPDISQLF